MEGYIGQIILFAGNFAPRTWAFCEGQLLAISSNTALFSILGTTYGGDGRTTFALPDLRGRAGIHQGSGPGLSNYRLGQKGGVEDVTLNITQIPSHQHGLTGTATVGGSVDVGVNTGNANSANPTAGAFAAGAFYSSSAADGAYAHVSHNLALAGNTANAGGTQQHENMQPWLSTYYVICLQGIFPSRS